MTDYLKAKDSDTIAKAKFTGTQDLWGSGLLSKNNYLSEKSNVVDKLVSKALDKAGVRKEEIHHWCMHPGGKKILLLPGTQPYKNSSTNGIV